MTAKLAPYVASRTLYAFDFDSVQVGPSMGYNDGYSNYSFDAIWTVRKNNKVQVSLGAVSQYQPGSGGFDYSYFCSHVDGRYGGTPLARWDGEFMWAPHTSLAKMNEYAELLEPIRLNIPEVPDGYSGWFSLSS